MADNTFSNQHYTYRGSYRAHTTQMIEILLDNRGNINQSAIDDYVKNFGVDSLYFGFDDTYQNHTLILGAIGLKGVSPETKKALIEYLLSKGANINNNQVDGLIAAALAQDEFDLAHFLYENGANMSGSYQHRSVIEIAIDSKQTDVITWVLKKAKKTFLEFDIQTFNEYMRKIIHATDNDAEVSQVIRGLTKTYIDAKHEAILNKFSRLGLIDKNITAIIVAAEQHRKQLKPTIFVIDDNDRSAIIAGIKHLLENNTVEDKIKFQIIHFPRTHAIYGEFVIDKTTSRPTVTYIHFDPLPNATPYNDIITSEFVQKIKPFADIEVVDSKIKIQKGLGCSYYSIDGALMLVTPQDRPYVPDHLSYMKEHSNQPEVINDIVYYKANRLPVRLIRGSQLYEDEPSGTSVNLGLKMLVFQSKEKDTIVNKKGETAEVAINKHLEEASTSSTDEIKKINLRAVQKMAHHKKHVASFLQEFPIINDNTMNLIEETKITGFRKFCESKTQQRIFNPNNTK